MQIRLPHKMLGGAQPPASKWAMVVGAGNSTNCYATIGGTKRIGQGAFTVSSGNTMVFGVYGRSATYKGSVTIDGVEVLSVTNQSVQTYTWTVPASVRNIGITLEYVSVSSRRHGIIVVTTS